MQSLVKSPLNYIGNKYRTLPQLLQIFPKNINTFIDLFTGGGDVVANVTAQYKIANDINKPVIEILQSFQSNSLNDIMNYIDKRIDEFNLNKTNEEGYLNYRKLYNTNNSGYDTPLDLFIITRFSYNQIIRFNNKMEFNAAFGKNRSSYNDNMRNNTIAFCPRLKNIQLTSTDFRIFDLTSCNKDDFLYVDPPYLIANADYNAGRTAKLSWNVEDEKALHTFLDKATEQELKWGMSNFIKHKDKINTVTEKWAREHNYNIYNIKADYSKLTTKVERITQPTLEVLITNYEEGYNGIGMGMSQMS